MTILTLSERHNCQIETKMVFVPIAFRFGGTFLEQRAVYYIQYLY